MAGLKITRYIGGNMEQTYKNGKKILCIEDESFISELYARALRRSGYEVNTLISGIDGLRAAQSNEYDIILLDLMIPGMTGFEVLRQLRASVGDLKAKILITTNLDQSDESKEELESMADGYLIKAEFTPRQLVSIIDDISAGKQLSDNYNT